MGVLVPEERRVFGVIGVVAVVAALAIVVGWWVRRDESIPFREVSNSAWLDSAETSVITDPEEFAALLDDLGVSDVPPFDPNQEVVFVVEPRGGRCPSGPVVDLRYDPDRHRMFPEVADGRPNCNFEAYTRLVVLMVSLDDLPAEPFTLFGRSKPDPLPYRQPVLVDPSNL